MGFQKFLIPNTLAGSIIVVTSTLLLIKVCRKAKPNYSSYGLVFCILINMIVSWLFQIILIAFKTDRNDKLIKYDLGWSVFLIPLDAFYFSFWYFESTQKTIGCFENRVVLRMVQVLKFAIPILTYLFVFGTIGPFLVLYYWCVSITQFLSYVTDITSFFVLIVVIFRVDKFAKKVQNGRFLVNQNGTQSNKTVGLNKWVAFLHCSVILGSSFFFASWSNSIYAILLGLPEICVLYYTLCIFTSG